MSPPTLPALLPLSRVFIGNDDARTHSALTVPFAQHGDANIDGFTNALDITKVERVIAGLAPPTIGSDANQDGNVNSLDITRVERIIARLD